MSTVTSKTQPCKACGQPVGQRAQVCPHCGEQWPSPWMARRAKTAAYASMVWAAIIVAMVAAAAYMCSGALVP